MTLSVTELLRKIEQGEDLETISQSLISAPEKGLLKCCAVVRTFDEELVDECFRKQIPHADKKSLPFDTLISHSFVQRVPRTDGVYSLQPAQQNQFYEAWWELPNGKPVVSKGRVPQELRSLSERLLKYYQDSGRGEEMDLLGQQVFVDKTKAFRLFKKLYRAADEAFDLARCRDLLNVFLGRENVLGPSFSQALNDKGRYLQSRSLWSTEYYQTVSYYERKKLSRKLETFLANSKKWIFHLHAPGGMGKTMFVRWLISRRCVPEPYTIPCGRVDFDFVDRIKASQHRWLLFLQLARDLEAQIPGNFFHTLILKFSDRERILNHAQQATPGTAVSLPPRETLEDEMSYLFSKALKDASLAKPIFLIFDTLEEVILYHPEDVIEIVRQVETLRQTVPEIRLILSGRYPLTKSADNLSLRLPEFDKKFRHFTQTVRVKPFAKKEALGFLHEKKGLPRNRPLEAVAAKADGNPFKLALFADILLDDPSITADTIYAYESADLLYLIERVLARIPDKRLHWLLRYGVVPRKLTLSFVQEVMKPHLQLAMSGNATQDDPRRYESLTQKNQQKVKEKEIFAKNILSSPDQELNVDQLWTELQNYASNFAWVTMEKADPNTVTFHGDVINPMRRWLEKEPVYKLLHQDAIAYFENKARTGSADWITWMRNAVYHKFQLEGAAAVGYWRQVMSSENATDNPRQRRPLADEIIGLDYVDEDLKPRVLLDGREIINFSILAEANYELARASVEIARAENAPANNQLWSDADYDLKKCDELQQLVPEKVISPAAVAVVRAAILTSQGKVDEASKIIEHALSEKVAESEQLNLEIEFVAALVAAKKYPEAIVHGQRALQLAQRLRSNPKTILELRLKLARVYRAALDLQKSSLEYAEALSLIPRDDAQTRNELLIELTEVYSSMGQFALAGATIEKLLAFENAPLDASLDNLRCWDHTIRLQLVSGYPAKALEAIRSAEATANELGSLNVVPETSRHAYSSLVILNREQLGIVRGELLEADEAVEALEFARSQWRELGDSQAVGRCMLQKANVWLNSVGDVGRARSILEEHSRLSSQNVPADWLEQGLLGVRLMQLADGKRGRDLGLTVLKNKAKTQELTPASRAQFMLATGIWEGLSHDKEAANTFFSAVTRDLKEVTPPSARMLLLEPLREYPICRKLDPNIAEDFASLFPLKKDDDDFIIFAPRVAEALRVIRKRKQALALLDDFFEVVPKDNLFKQREAWLVRARTWLPRNFSDPLPFINEFLSQLSAFPLLCGSTLVEFAELALRARAAAILERLLKSAETYLIEKDPNTQWMARFLAVLGKLSVMRDPGTVRDESVTTDFQRAMTIFASLGNNSARADIKDFINQNTARPQERGAPGLLKAKAETKKEVARELAPAAETKEYLGTNELVGPPLALRQATTTFHFQNKFEGGLMIKSAGLGRPDMKTGAIFDKEPFGKQLLSFESYENYSFGLLKFIDSNWLAVCREMGRILRQEEVFEHPAKDGEQSVLRLIIDLLQISAAPWELMTLPRQVEAPASVSPLIKYLYRSTGENVSTTLADIKWLQMALGKLGNQHFTADGVYGKLTQNAVSQFQREHGLPDDGIFDGQTRRQIKAAMRSQSGRERPRVLLLRPGINRQRALSRGHQIWGFSPEKWYREAGFKDVLIVEDPERKKMGSSLKTFEPDIIHVFPTMQESTSIGIYLDFLGDGSGLPTTGGDRMPDKDPSSGKVEFFTLSALAEMIRMQQKRDRSRPLIILDVLEPPGRTELFTQLLLRNAFASQLYQTGFVESIIATGLTPVALQEKMTRTLIAALGAGEAVGDTVNRLRRAEDLGSYTRLADVHGKPGPLRNPSDNAYLSKVVAMGATALFTQDPTM